MTKFFSFVSVFTVVLTKKTKPEGKSITFYHVDGLCFWLIINGEKINHLPQSKVTVENIKKDSINLAVIFVNEKIEHIVTVLRFNSKLENERDINIKISQRKPTKAFLSYRKGSIKE